MPVAAHYLEILDKDNQRIDGESEGNPRLRDIDGSGWMDVVGWIEVVGWDWDVTDKSASNETDTSRDRTSAGAAKGAAKSSTGGVEVGIDSSLLTFRKPVDRSTTRLMGAMYGGHVLNQARFRLFEVLTGGKNELKVGFQLDVVLKKVVVVSYALGGRSSEHRVDLDETWQLSYSTITLDYVSGGGGMYATFNRPPESTKGGASKPEVDPVKLQKQLAEVQQQLAAVKGKRG